MEQLPDTDKRIDDLPQQVNRMWNEHGWRCHCGNPLLIGSKDKLYCNRCHRYWTREEAERTRELN